jgi:hypothetical protein
MPAKGSGRSITDVSIRGELTAPKVFKIHTTKDTKCTKEILEIRSRHVSRSAIQRERGLPS